jgi:predicted RNA binding protein YcfA (HicA-like mRNA interferase family)
MINNQQSITETSSTTPSYNLLLEIAQIPEEYIPEFLQIVWLFRENVIKKQTSIDDKNIGTVENHQLSWQEFINKTAGSCAYGWSLKRITGSYHIYVQEGMSVILSIPVHGNLDLPTGTLRSILKDAGLTEEDLD